MTIVGIVGNVRQTSLESEIHPEIDRPIAQDDRRWLAPRDMVIRTTGDPVGVAPAVRDAMRAIDPGVPLVSMQSYAAIVANSIAPGRVVTTAVASFAVLALVLALVGITGMVAYVVA